MIVLDEQLEDPDVRAELARWYPGAITYLTELRPNTIVKDDSVAELLRRVHEPTFVTIDVRGFWRKIEPDERFSVMCFELPCSRILELSRLLRRVLSVGSLRTRRSRAGKVVLVRPTSILWYTDRRQQPERFEWR